MKQKNVFDDAIAELLSASERASKGDCDIFVQSYRDGAKKRAENLRLAARVIRACGRGEIVKVKYLLNKAWGLVDTVNP